MRMNTSRAGAVVLTMAAVAACSSGGGGGSGDTPPPPANDARTFELTLEEVTIEHMGTSQLLSVEGLPATGNTVRVESQNSK